MAAAEVEPGVEEEAGVDTDEVPAAVVEEPVVAAPVVDEPVLPLDAVKQESEAITP